MPLDRPGFFTRYKDAILFNRNLIISGTGGFFASAYVSKLYKEAGSSDFANSAVALAVEYAIYLPAFVGLFYIDNRKKYVDPVSGRRDRRRVLHDIKKLFAAFSVSEVLFSITRVIAQYGLLQAGIPPFEASMTSSLLAWGVFFLAINSMAKLVKLFKG